MTDLTNHPAAVRGQDRAVEDRRKAIVELSQQIAYLEVELNASRLGLARLVEIERAEREEP